MALSAGQRAAIIEEVIANSTLWEEGDEATLNRFTDDKLLKMREHTETTSRALAVANAAVEGIETADGKAYRVNPDNGRWEQRITDNGMEEEQTAPAKKKKMGLTEEDYRIDDEENAGEVMNRRKPTRDELLRQLPADVKEMLANAQQIEAQEKAKVIDKILVNVTSPSDRQAQYERLMQHPLQDLYNTLALIPAGRVENVMGEEDGSNGRRHRSNPVTNEEDEDMLQLPTLNWKDATNDTQQKRRVVNNHDDDYTSDEEWLQNAPASVRNRVKNAMAIEEREKQKFIDALTANVVDEEKERQLIKMLQHKPLEELKMLAALSPATNARPNYFGANTPLSNGKASQAALTANDQDDILPIPRLDFSQK